MIGIPFLSYAQFTSITSETEAPSVLLQLTLRDSKGNLVTYLETSHVIAMDSLKLDEFLKNQNPIMVNNNGKDNEIIQWQGKTQKFHENTAESQFTLWGEDQDGFQKILVLGHNSYQTRPGDSITSYWTITSPAN